MKNTDLGSFTVDVQLQENGLYDVYIAHEGSSGEHYKDVSANRIGKLLAGDIECIAEGYLREFGDDDSKLIQTLAQMGLNKRDIDKIISVDFIKEALMDEADFDIYKSVEEYGEANCNNGLFEEDDSYYSFGKFLLSVPDANNLLLPSGKVIVIDNSYEPKKEADDYEL